MTTNPTKDDRREQFGSCEVCRTAIFVGDQYGPTDDGIYCEEHTFMLSDVENQLASFASDGTGDGVMRDHAEVLEDLTTIRADLAENGGPQGLIHSVTGAFPQCELVRGLRMTAITYGNVRIAKVRAAFDIHRQAAHSGGVEAIQETSSQIDNGEGHK